MNIAIFQNDQLRRRVVLITIGFLLRFSAGVVTAQDDSAKAAPAKPATEPVTARLYYENAEPKLIFQTLSSTYHVQFDEGIETVTQPITLITPEDRKVDLQGMLELLNAALARENKTAILQGNVVRIVPLQDTMELWLPLKYASPEQIVPFLRDLYLPRPEDKPEDRARKVKEIKAHPQLPQIMVVGPTEVVRDIERMVKEKLDLPAGKTTAPSPSARPAVRRHYLPLEYMDAEEFSKLILQDQALNEQFQFTTAVAPNNTLIVSTQQEELFARIDELKNTFDVDKMEIRYIKLSNADPADIAKLLREIYPNEAKPLPPEIQRIRRQRLAEPSAAPQYSDEQIRQMLAESGISEISVEDLLSPSLSIVAVGELTIVEDVKRNALLIRTFSRNFPKVLELLQELDMPQDQVLIDVFITEVNLDDLTEFGVDFTYTDDVRVRGAESPYTVSQGVDTASIEFGLSYQLISDNITAFIKALQQTDKFNLVTRPQIVTKDNTQAEIELGRRVPLVQDTKVSTEGAVTSTVKYEPVLTQLLVTPHIHPNEYITLDIEQTIDDIGTETFQISEEFNPQVIIKRRAKTNLRVKDGQTVCLGGFVQDKLLETDRGVPILKDLPWIGFLFRFTSINHVKQELIIFITPHVLSTPQDMLRMTNAQRRASSAHVEKGSGDDVLTEQDDLRPPPYRQPTPPQE